jgi:hypothetical protein
MSEYGAAVEWYWQGKTEGLWENPVPVPLRPSQIPHRPPWERIRVSAVRNLRLTARAMARLELLCNSKVLHRNHKSQQLNPILSQLNLIPGCQITEEEALCLLCRKCYCDTEFFSRQNHKDITIMSGVEKMEITNSRIPNHLSWRYNHSIWCGEHDTLVHICNF